MVIAEAPALTIAHPGLCEAIVGLQTFVLQTTQHFIQLCSRSVWKFLLKFVLKFVEGVFPAGQEIHGGPPENGDITGSVIFVILFTLFIFYFFFIFQCNQPMYSVDISKLC